MPSNLFERLAELPVPPPPTGFNAALHQKLNNRLVAGQLLDFATRGLGFAMWNIAQAAGGLVRLTLTGKLEPRSDDGTRPAP
jgi:hypothetical protein